MRILHYFLGFPPYRTGGLTKYAFDLMLTQLENGDEVLSLFPGKMGFVARKVRIKQRKSVKGIKSFELINPLPISLDEGIKDADAFMQSINLKVYKDFLLKCNPDAIHIHTLMGLHREFLDAAKELNIRTVFTSHDYFGLCPKVTLYRYGKCCDDDHGCKDCIQCNLSALSLTKIKLLQSPLYRLIKESKPVKKLRAKHRNKFFEEEVLPSMPDCNVDELAEQYRKLRLYYVGMLESIDFIHFNSSVTEKVYNRYFHPKNSAVISITHRDIKDNRRIKDFNRDVLKITYLGPAKPYKGFQFLIGALDKIWESEKSKFELHIYSETSVERDYITYKQAGYPYSQLKEIFEDTDLLVVPSQWYETFGFTVLEALSYGVPVLVSEKVGAKDLVSDKFVFNNDEFENMLRKILLNKSCLLDENKRIINSKLPIGDNCRLKY